MLTLLGLPNLLANLKWIERQQFGDELVLGVATCIEGLLRKLYCPHALAQVQQTRNRLSQQIKGWNHTQFIAEAQLVEHLLDEGAFFKALDAAKALLEKAQTEKGDSYDEASCDLAKANWLMGRALLRTNDAVDALSYINAALSSLQLQTNIGNTRIAENIMTILTEKGNCLAVLGRLDEAVEVYEKRINLDKDQKDTRGLAIAYTQIAGVQLRKENYQVALSYYSQVIDIFTELNDQVTLADVWYGRGIALQEMGQFERAEESHLRSLHIHVQLGNQWGEVQPLNQLALLYQQMGRLEEAVALLQQAASCYEALDDIANEGRVRGNLAILFIKLKRSDDARIELMRVIKCSADAGHAAEPWKIFDILTDLEHVEGNNDAAFQAREKAISTFLSYRRDGGENLCRTSISQFIALTKEGLQGSKPEVSDQLKAFQREPDFPDYIKRFIVILQNILVGNYDGTLIYDPEFSYEMVVELKLLLEKLTVDVTQSEIP